MCHWRGQIQIADVPEVPGYQKGAANPTPAAGRKLSTSHSSQACILLRFLMPGYCSWVLKEELCSRDIFLFFCLKGCACQFSFKHWSAPEQQLQRLPPAALTPHWPNKQKHKLLLNPALVWEREMKRDLIWPVVWMDLLSKKASVLLGLWSLCCSQYRFCLASRIC